MTTFAISTTNKLAVLALVAVSDVSRHLIQRWLHHRVDAITTNKTIPPLIPFTEGVVNAAGGPHLSCEGILRKMGEGEKVGVEFRYDE